MPEPAHYRDDSFIWDVLQEQVERALDSIYVTWRAEGRIAPFLISWPSETILNRRGLPDDGPQQLDLPPDRTTWSGLFRRFTIDTKAYALGLVEQKATEVLLILESHRGTRSWSFPILTSGDLRYLGDAVPQRNIHRIGVLWQPSRGVA